MKLTLIIASLATVAFSAPVVPHTNRSPAAPHTNRDITPHTNRRQSDNFQTFTAALGGIEATPVLDSGIANRPFSVKGDTFVNIGAALQRSCDQQFNACANAANGEDATLSVPACSTQKDQCSASVQASTAASKQGANTENTSNANSNNNAGQVSETSGCTLTNRKGKRE